jgi:adenylate cyclase
MIEASLTELCALLAEAGLAGTPELDIVTGFCERCTAAGLPLDQSQLFIDTLHPVHEGRLFRWGHHLREAPVIEYGRTNPEVIAASGASAYDLAAAESWRGSPFYKMMQSGESLLRRRLKTATTGEFRVVSDLVKAGMTDYVAIITRFAAEGVIGEMDGVYMSCATRAADGFEDRHIATLTRGRPIPRARRQIGLARAHDLDADGDLSRP